MTAQTAAAQSRPKIDSVLDHVVTAHPELEVQRFTKTTLLGLSWAIEDEFCARAQQPVLIGAFQEPRFWERSRRRWTELAKISRGTLVMADFDDPTAEPAPGASAVPVPVGTPMAREWLVVCDAPDLPAALLARELPGQGQVPDRQREFEGLWTTEVDVVRTAARAATTFAADAGVAAAAPLLYHLAGDQRVGPVSAQAVSRLFNRIVAYLNQATLPTGMVAEPA